MSSGETFYGGAGAETLLGTNGNDTFYNSAGDDKIWGGMGGTDLLVLSGNLSDYSIADNGNGSYTITDLRENGEGSDIVRSIELFQFADKTVTLENLLQQATNNVIEGTSGAETLLGTAGNDVFHAGAGDDRLWGGANGDDTAVFTGNASDYTIKDNGNGSYTITDGRGIDGVDVIRDIEMLQFADETISTDDFLTSMPNEVAGGAGSDVQLGTAGNDRFVASAGDDKIWGGTGGDDILVLTGSFDDYAILDRRDGSYSVIDLRSGSPEGTDKVRAIGTFEFADRTATLGEFLEAHPTNYVYDGLGTAGNDIVIGSSADDVLQGSGGKDRIWGGEDGNDTVVFTGNFNDYEVTNNDNGAFTVKDLREGAPDGTAVVRDVENFQFADGTLSQGQILDGNHDLATTLRGTAAEDNMSGAHTDGVFDAHTNDLMIGNAGIDHMRGGPGDDELLGDSEAVTETHVFTQFPDTDLPRFEFEPGLYQAIYGQLKKLNPETGEYELIGEDNPNYNAAGLNPADGYAYAIGRGGDIKNHLLRIGSNGEYESLGSGYPGSFAGDFAADGLMYVRTGNTTFKTIDVYTGAINTVNFTGENVPTVHDLVFIPNDNDGTLYGISVNGVLVAYDLTDHTVETAAVDGLIVGQGAYGAGWTSADGGLYFSHNRTGNIYGVSGVENMEPSAAQLSVGEQTNVNDGFSFGTAELPEELLGAGGDHLLGGHGNDTLRGQDGNDLLNGGEGADHLDGGADFDTADYSHAEEAVTINLATGVHTGQAQGDTYAGIEQYAGTVYHDTMTGDGSVNHFEGRAGDDMLSGGAGNDHLSGDAGDDTLEGGAGDDFLRGGLGADTFVFAAGAGNDTIRDFETGIDTMDFTAFGAELSFEDISYALFEDDTVISWQVNGESQQVTLEDYALANLADIESSMLFA